MLAPGDRGCVPIEYCDPSYVERYSTCTGTSPACVPMGGSSQTVSGLPSDTCGHLAYGAHHTGTSNVTHWSLHGGFGPAHGGDSTDMYFDRDLQRNLIQKGTPGWDPPQRQGFADRAYYGHSYYSRVSNMFAGRSWEDYNHYGQLNPWIQGPWKNPYYLPDGSKPSGLWLAFDSIESGMGGPQTWNRLPPYRAVPATHQYGGSDEAGYLHHGTLSTCRHQGQVQVHNRVVLLAGEVQFQDDQNQHETDGGIFAGYGWMGIPLLGGQDANNHRRQRNLVNNWADYDSWVPANAYDGALQSAGPGCSEARLAAGESDLPCLEWANRSQAEQGMRAWPRGDGQCASGAATCGKLTWTFFLDTANARGPIVAYAPEFFTRNISDWVKSRNLNAHRQDPESVPNITGAGSYVDMDESITIGHSAADMQAGFGGEMPGIEDIILSTSAETPQSLARGPICNTPRWMRSSDECTSVYSGPKYFKFPELTIPNGSASGKEYMTFDARLYNVEVYNQYMDLFNAPAITAADFETTRPKLLGSRYRRMGTGMNLALGAIPQPTIGGQWDRIQLKFPLASEVELNTARYGVCTPDFTALNLSARPHQCRWPFEFNGDGSVETGRIEPAVYFQWDNAARDAIMTRGFTQYWKATSTPEVTTAPVLKTGETDALNQAGVHLTNVLDDEEIAELPAAFRESEWARTTTGPMDLKVHDIDLLEAQGIVGQNASLGQQSPPSTASRERTQAEMWCWTCDETPGAGQQCSSELTTTTSGGTVVYYRYFKWRDQPTMRQLAHEFPDSYTEGYLTEMQERIEFMHTQWINGDTKEFLHRPKKIVEDLHMAEIDHGLVLTPPSGMETGWVPIVTQTKLPGKFTRQHYYRAEGGSSGSVSWI